MFAQQVFLLKVKRGLTYIRRTEAMGDEGMRQGINTVPISNPSLVRIG